MNRDPASLERYLDLIATREAQDLVIIGVSVEGDGLILAGAHAAHGFCWCQPVAISLPCYRNEAHGEHVRVNHRRAMDSMILDDDNPAGFSVDRKGNTYPAGQVIVGPEDRPELDD